MGFLDIFSGKAPQEYEQKGDHLFNSGAFGDAKLEYEAGLHKLEKKDPRNSKLKRRFQEKVIQSREALALQHRQRGDEILASQCYEEAEDAFRLAMDLTENSELQAELRKRLQEIQDLLPHETEMGIQNLDYSTSDLLEGGYAVSDDEYFTALCGSFSDREREKAYQSYGPTFKQGYLALNQGDFDLAANRLSQALDENGSQRSYIPLELATAYLNLGRPEEARQLLEAFLKDYPNSLQGIQLLCESYWEMEAFEQAHELLRNCHPNLADSSHVRLLQGETLFRAKRFQEAKSLFLDHLSSIGWDENIALSLAKTHEALDDKEKARDLYGSVMNNCTSCGNRIDPFIKQRYADLSLECGQSSTKTLELYLSLVPENPDNRAHYYQKISEIYSAQGNEEEAMRYLALMKKVM